MTNEFSMPAASHHLELTGREHLTVSGVEDVERFDESGVIMTTSAGTLNRQGGFFSRLFG